MKLNISLVFVVVSIISCERNNFETIYDKKTLTIEDCKNIELANWLLLKETGLVVDQDIQMIVTDYDGGIPLQIENLPIYYKVQINENQYEKYKMILLSNKRFNGWRYDGTCDRLYFALVNKFELSCKIEKDMIYFGFRMVEGIAP